MSDKPLDRYEKYAGTPKRIYVNPELAESLTQRLEGANELTYVPIDLYNMQCARCRGLEAERDEWQKKAFHWEMLYLRTSR